MANYPYELAQDAAYQSYTSRLTELWSLPKPAQGLNTYNNNKEKILNSPALEDEGISFLRNLGKRVPLTQTHIPA